MKKKGMRCIGMLLTMILLILQASCGISEEDISYLESELQQEVIEIVSLEAEVIAIPEADDSVRDDETASSVSAVISEITDEAAIEAADSQAGEEWLVELPQEGEYYYDLENVVLYLYLYDELPHNYLTKSEARDLGWEGGSVEKYQEGAAIGGDRFGNREGLLPEDDDRTYIECDIDTDGRNSRGAKRLVFSDDGLYFYTEDHYESFDEVIVTESYEVIW